MYRHMLYESWSTASEENDNCFLESHPSSSSILMICFENLTWRTSLKCFDEENPSWKPWMIHTIWWTICGCCWVSEKNIIYTTSWNNYLVLAPDKVQIFCNNKSNKITNTGWIISIGCMLWYSGMGLMASLQVGTSQKPSRLSASSSIKSKWRSKGSHQF